MNEEKTPQKEISTSEARNNKWHFWFLVSFSLLLIVTFVYYLPLRFLHEASTGDDHQTPVQEVDGHAHNGADDIHAGHELPSVTALGKLPLRTPSDRVERLPFITEEDGTKEFYLEASEFRWEYEPGKWVHVWGYNGQIPGPEIRVTEGDSVRVIVRNRLPDATTVHWHGVDVPWQADGVAGVTQKAIEPGEEFIYEFKATPAGTRFYHSHGKSHITSAQQMDMGLSGAFIVESRLPIVDYDREFTLVLDEWDILPGGINPALTHVHGAGEAGAVPDFNTFTINGRIFPHTDILDIKEGERILVRFINVGTAAFHPMHLHGHAFEVVAYDGFPDPRAPQEQYQRRNTITIHPGETTDILVTADNPGPWLLHCHHVHHAAAGMITLLQYKGYEPISGIESMPAISPPTMPSGQVSMMTPPPVTSTVKEETGVKEGIAVNLNVSPVPVMANVPAKLDFFVSEKPGNIPIEARSLELEHTKRMHIMGVRSDINEFFHIHPEPDVSPGIFSVEHTFVKPGSYKLWSEIKKDATRYTFAHPLLEVEGQGEREMKQVSFEKTVNLGDYQVLLTHDEPLVKGREAMLTFDIHTFTGAEVELEAYLGSPMHLAIIKDDFSQFIHTHPGQTHSHGSFFFTDAYANGAGTHVQDPSQHGVSFYPFFPEVGLYKVFAQFRPKGTSLALDDALTASFWIEVEEKASFISAWWGLLLTSFILMLILSFVVHKYINGHE